MAKLEIPKVPKRFWDDKEWAFDHYSEWVQKYKNKWVCVFNKKIVAVGKDLGEVKERARKKANTKHIPVIFIEDGSHVY